MLCLYGNHRANIKDLDKNNLFFFMPMLYSTCESFFSLREGKRGRTDLSSPNTKNEKKKVQVRSAKLKGYENLRATTVKNLLISS